MRKSEKREKRKERPKLLFLAEHWHQPILHKTEGQHKKKMVAKTEEQKKLRLKPVYERKKSIRDENIGIRRP